MAKVYRILHLTDLHFSANTNFVPDDSQTKQKIAQAFLDGRDLLHYKDSQNNYKNILSNFSNVIKETGEINHIVITGDIANFGFEEEYEIAIENLKELETLLKKQKIFSQQRSQPRNELRNTNEDKPKNDNELDPNLFTIVPGNHDRIQKKISRNPKKWFSRFKRWLVLGRLTIIHSYAIKKGILGCLDISPIKHLELFFKYFGSTFPIDNNNTNSEDVFPIIKTNLNNKIGIIGLNTTFDIPVHIIELNPFGVIANSQLNKLGELLDSPENKKDYQIILLHHYPLPIYATIKNKEYLKFLNSEGLLHVPLMHKDTKVIFLCGHIHSYRYFPVINNNRFYPHIIAAASPIFYDSTDPELQLPLSIHEFSDNNNGTIAYNHIVYKLKYDEINRKMTINKHIPQAIMEELMKMDEEQELIRYEIEKIKLMTDYEIIKSNFLEILSFLKCLYENNSYHESELQEFHNVMSSMDIEQIISNKFATIFLTIEYDIKIVSYYDESCDLYILSEKKESNCKMLKFEIMKIINLVEKIFEVQND